MPYRKYWIGRALFVWPWSALSYAAFVAVILWQGVLWLTFDPRQPVTFDSVEVRNSPLRPGDILIARIYRDKVRDDCPLTAERMAMNQDGEITHLETVSWPGGPSGTPYFDVAYSIPEDMPEGLYTLRVRVTYHCPRGLDFNLTQPLAQFRVLLNPGALVAPAMGIVPPGLVAPSAP